MVRCAIFEVMIKGILYDELEILRQLHSEDVGDRYWNELMDYHELTV